MSAEYHRLEDWQYALTWPDPFITQLLLGIPLPEYFNDPETNGNLRYALAHGMGWYEPHHSAFLARCKESNMIKVLQTLMEFKRMRPAYELYSKKTGNSLLISTEAPDFSHDDIWRVKTTNGWKRYPEDKVKVAQRCVLTPKWEKLRKQLSP